MPRDRNDYRSLGTPLLLRIAREEGMNEEMAVAIAERLAVAALAEGQGAPADVRDADPRARAHR